MSIVQSGTIIYEVVFKQHKNASPEKNTCIGDKQLSEFIRLSERAGHIIVSSTPLWTHGDVMR